ncbi:branched-chain amino acid ABC transporter permease [Rhodovibrionaceae bacterium A322]
MEYEISLAILAANAVVLALSLNLITGYCGQISLGHAAFYGMGAYTAAMLTTSGFPFFLALPLGGLLAGLMGVIVGLASLRVRDDFLAITTMGVNFLFIGIVRQQDWLGGEMGIFGIPDVGLGRIGFLIMVLALAVAVILLSLYVKRSWMGFAFDAIADDEDTARMVGTDVARYKLAAFAMGTTLAGIAGGIYAHEIKYIGPDSFGFVESIAVLSMVVIGGIGSVPGVIVAALVLTLLPQWLQFIAEYKLFLYGGLLFLVMRFSPDGLAGLIKRLLKKEKEEAGQILSREGKA